MQALSQAKEEFYKDLMRRKNVVGVGVGPKIRGNEKMDEDAVVVLVREKLPQEKLSDRDTVPKHLGHGISTDVVEIGQVKTLALTEDGEKMPFRHDRQRPAPGGVSVGHREVTSGTLAVWVRDKESGEPLILSNNHVIANTTSGNDGRASINDPVLQPGPYDGGDSSNDVIAHLKGFVPIYLEAAEAQCPTSRQFEQSLNLLLQLFVPGYRVKFHRLSEQVNLVDAAVASPVETSYATDEILGLGKIQGVRKPGVGMRVIKSGRSSGISEGEINVVDTTIKIDMGPIGTAVFDEQIVTSRMASPGDSGSLLIDRENYAVGLLAAGSNQSSVACRIDHVLNSLNIRF